MARSCDAVSKRRFEALCCFKTFAAPEEKVEGQAAVMLVIAGVTTSMGRQETAEWRRDADAVRKK